MLEANQLRECKGLTGQETSILNISRMLASSRIALRNYFGCAIPHHNWAAQNRKQPAQDKIHARVAQRLCEEKDHCPDSGHCQDGYR